VSAHRALGTSTCARRSIRIVVAVKRADGHMLSNPSGDQTMQAGDTLIVVGGTAQLDRLKKLAGDGNSSNG
jgi:K+/H+ antiporter YhaU regulatory subunit KhtT